MKDPSIAAFWLITFPQIMYGYNYDDNAKQTVWSEYKVVASTIHVLTFHVIGSDIHLFFHLYVFFACSD
jgi:hypothetical protein